MRVPTKKMLMVLNVVEVSRFPVIIKISNLASVDFVKSYIFLQYLTDFVYSNKLKTTVNLNNGLLIRTLY